MMNPFDFIGDQPQFPQQQFPQQPINNRSQARRSNNRSARNSRYTNDSDPMFWKAYAWEQINSQKAYLRAAWLISVDKRNIVSANLLFEAIPAINPTVTSQIQPGSQIFGYDQAVRIALTPSELSTIATILRYVTQYGAKGWQLLLSRAKANKRGKLFLGVVELNPQYSKLNVIHTPSPEITSSFEIAFKFNNNNGLLDSAFIGVRQNQTMVGLSVGWFVIEELLRVFESYHTLIANLSVELWRTKNAHRIAQKPRAQSNTNTQQQQPSIQQAQQIPQTQFPQQFNQQPTPIPQNIPIPQSDVQSQPVPNINDFLGINGQMDQITQNQFEQNQATKESKQTESNQSDNETN